MTCTQCKKEYDPLPQTELKHVYFPGKAKSKNRFCSRSCSARYNGTKGGRK